MLAYRHSLRVVELIALRWDQIDLEQGVIHGNRVKNGTPSARSLRSPELRDLRRLRRESPGAYIFVRENKRAS